jgi:aspartate--ammonia ligase
LNGESLKKQLELTHQLDFLKYPYHHAIVNHGIPFECWRRDRAVTDDDANPAQCASRLGERHDVPKVVLKEMCENKNIHVLN